METIHFKNNKKIISELLKKGYSLNIQTNKEYKYLSVNIIDETINLSSKTKYQLSKSHYEFKNNELKIITNYQFIHRNLINKSGGKVEDIFVVNPGVMITQETKTTKEANELLKEFNIPSHQHNHNEFNAKLTYLSFPEIRNPNYLENMVNQHGHLSIFNDTYITVLIAGVSIETELEFVAHNEATIARLTSSRTFAQNNPLYSLGKIEETYNFQKKLIKDFNSLKDELLEYKNINELDNKLSIDKTDLNELKNMLNPGNKVSSFTITMSLKDWHKTFIGRLSNKGVEKEVQDICKRIVLQLRKKYSLLIKTPEEYYEMNNSKKYKG